MIDFSEKVISALDERSVEPKPRWHFLLKRSVFWSLAALSIFIGGIALSVAFYVFVDNDGLASVQNPRFQDILRDIAQSIPYVWLIVLGLFTASAYFGFRKTRKGYRYATVKVVSIAILLSMIFGLVLDSLDFGQAVHKYLLSNTAIYDALIRSSEDEGDYRGSY